jgi:hypothetical protein
MPILPPSSSPCWKEVIAAPRSMPVVIGLLQEGATVEGGPTSSSVAPQHQGWRALLHRHRALGLHRRAASGLHGGDCRRKAWPPSTAGACMASVARLASLHRCVVTTTRRYCSGWLGQKKWWSTHSTTSIASGGNSLRAMPHHRIASVASLHAIAPSPLPRFTS